jgi:hypothetical protein
LRWVVCFDSFPKKFGEGVCGVFSPVPREDRLFFAGDPALFFAGFFKIFLLGMAIFFRVEESHHGAVECVAMMRAETVAGSGAAQATMPGWSRGARWHEGDAAGHGRRDEMRKAKFEKGKLKIEIR